MTFIWDGDVIAREITETRGGTRTVDWFFEPNSFRPMARLENGQLSQVLNDHLGTPKEVVGGDGALLWSADHDTWGTLRTKRAAVGAQEEAEDYWLTLETSGLRWSVWRVNLPVRYLHGEGQPHLQDDHLRQSHEVQSSGHVY